MRRFVLPLLAFFLWGSPAVAQVTPGSSTSGGGALAITPGVLAPMPVSTPAALAPLRLTPAVPFGYYRCSCSLASVGEPALASRFGTVQTTPWSGSVYARTDTDASYKARNACSAETAGHLLDCVSCACSRLSP